MSKIKKIFAALSACGADAMLVSTELNQRYISGFDYSDGYILVTQSKAYLLADFRYIEAARDEVKDTDVEVIMPKSGMLIELAALISENSVKTLMIEDESLSCSARDRLAKSLEGTDLVFGASKILNEMRQIKDADELAKIIEAQKITDAAFTHILSMLSPEMTEIDVALELEFFMRRNGAESTAFDTIAVSGSASSMPHGVPRNKKLEKGFLTMDFGARYKGYCADMTRTVVIGRADGEMKKLYSTVLNAQLAALEMIGEGVCCFELDKCARDIIYGAGYEGCFRHSLGHGIGMQCHESPRVAPSAQKDSRLVRGNVTSVEPGIYVLGKYGCRIEDLVAIDLDGTARNLTKSDKKLIELF